MSPTAAQFLEVSRQNWRNAYVFLADNAADQAILDIAAEQVVRFELAEIRMGVLVFSAPRDDAHFAETLHRACPKTG